MRLIYFLVMVLTGPVSSIYGWAVTRFTAATPRCELEPDPKFRPPPTGVYDDSDRIRWLAERHSR